MSSLAESEHPRSRKHEPSHCQAERDSPRAPVDPGCGEKHETCDEASAHAGTQYMGAEGGNVESCASQARGSILRRAHKEYGGRSYV